ncbi:retrotransposable element Tf2 [Tanacetum coccineum]
MTPATRTITSTSNNKDGDVEARLRSVEASLAQVTIALQEMNHMLNGDDVKGWIFTCEQFFFIDEIPENQKVKLISVHLFDTALLWHRQFIRLNREAKYTPGHKCSGQLYSIVILDDEELEGEEEYIEEESLMSEEDREFEGTSDVELLMFCVYPNTGVNLLNMEGQTKENGVDPELFVVVDTFVDVFEVPNELPPKRSHDHRIPLLPNTQPVNIRPYRYPPMQKDAIEVMVKELLDSGVIKPSNIKDKFPIPNIEELIEELHGAAIFSMLDLSISIEFIEGLPKSQGKNVILVVVDKLSKYAHFITLAHPFTAQKVAQAFLDNVYKLHGMPESIVSDRDKKTPFETVYRIPLPIHVPYLGGLSKVEVVDKTLKDREEFIQTLKFHLLRAQNRMKQQADKGRSERQFGIGDWVLLKLQPHRQVTVRMGTQHKFSPKYYGPFKDISRVGQVAYQLELNS